MKKTYIAIIVFINVILQISLYNFMSIFGVIPNVILVLVILFALCTNQVAGGLIGLLSGLMYDLLIMDVIGINALIYFIVGLVLGTFKEEINKENIFVYIIITLAATVFYHFVTSFIMFFLRRDISAVFLIIDKIVIQIFLNVGICLVLQKFLQFLFGLAGIKLFSNKE